MESGKTLESVTNTLFDLFKRIDEESFNHKMKTGGELRFYLLDHADTHLFENHEYSVWYSTNKKVYTGVVPVGGAHVVGRYQNIFLLASNKTGDVDEK